MPITIQLSQPIKDMNEEKTELVFREPTIGDVRKAKKESKDPQEQFLLIAQCCASITETAMNQVQAKDMDAIEEALSPFLPSSLIDAMTVSNCLGGSLTASISNLQNLKNLPKTT
jgi:Phage tail assembly chaperone proteins, E, or 41 or 14